MDITEIALPTNIENTQDIKSHASVQQYRDILKSASIKTHQSVVYVLLGIENQTNVHYAMPVRNMIYDALQYGRQVTEIASAHKHAHTAKISRAEYLSGFYKTDKLIPVITLVLYFNTNAWDGPLSLFDMMDSDIQKHDYAKYIQNYHLHLIEPSKISDEDLNKFDSSLREVLGCIKYAKDKNKLADFIHNNPRMNIDISAARVIGAITNTPIHFQKGDEQIDMCQAIEEMIQDGKTAGKIEGKIELISQLLRLNKITMNEASVLMHMSKEELENKIQFFS